MFRHKSSERGKRYCKVNWRFTISNDRKKLKKLYPVIEEINFMECYIKIKNNFLL